MTPDSVPQPELLSPNTTIGNGPEAGPLPVIASNQTPKASPVRNTPTPPYQSPMRHHHRAGSKPRQVKETLNARSEYSNSEDDGTAQHRINQYIIKQEIGRGSFGAVHLATDQFGNEYAVKEFSKSRLRKRAQSNYLRRPSVRRRGIGMGFNSPLHRGSPSKMNSEDALTLIREEIAIMKKLNHPNLVSLIEVLDDPDEDSLYMVLEMCKKGVSMKVGLEDRADPYDEEQCRCWFRDMILGLEYLHAQGIIHRDIKPDNCLITEDDILKIVDFGVSEMFEKDSDMTTAKSAGSPAFMPPELCVAKHGHVSGRAADIWSMGVTLYCLRFGRIPFEKTGMLELYESIRSDSVDLQGDCSEDLKDLLFRILEKDPEKRIKMDDIREHPWVTNRGSDPLLPKEENVAEIVEPPTQEEINAAITGNMGHLLVVMKAVRRFKELLFRRRPDLMEGIFGHSRIVQPPLSIRGEIRSKLKSFKDDHLSSESKPASSNVRQDTVMNDDNSGSLQEVYSSPPLAAPIPHSAAPHSIPSLVPSSASPQPRLIPKQHPLSPSPGPDIEPRRETGKGHAHDPLEDTLFLNIGTSADSPAAAIVEDGDPVYVVSESPSAVDFNVYEKAYQEEVDRVLNDKGRSATLYLTRRVEECKAFKGIEQIVDHSKSAADRTGFAKIVEKAKAAAATPSSISPALATLKVEVMGSGKTQDTD